MAAPDLLKQLQAVSAGDPLAGLGTPDANSAPPPDATTLPQSAVSLPPPQLTPQRAQMPNPQSPGSPEEAQTESDLSGQSESQPQPSFLAKLGRLAGGAVGFEDPNSSPQANLGSRIGSLIGRAGAGLALAAGTPEQKQLAEEQLQVPLKLKQIQNEMDYRLGLLNINQQNAKTKSQVAATGAQTEQDKYAAGDAAMGLPPGTTRETANAAALNAATNQELREERVKQIRASLEGTNHVDQHLAHALGRDDLADKDLGPLAYQNQIANVARSRGFHVVDTAQEGPDGGQWVLDSTGQKIYQVSPISPALARAKAYQSSKPVVDLNAQTGAQQYDTAGNAMQSHAMPGSAGHQMLAIWQPALDSGERLQVMQANLDRGLHGDQQAMLSLLANHLGMTMGLQKGARLNQAIISEAEKSRPWLEGMQTKYDDRGYLTGVTLSPQQMRQMVDLGQERYQADVQKARYAAPFAGVSEEPMLPVDPDKLTANPMPSSLRKVASNAPTATPTTGPKEGDTATGPGNHKIKFSGGHWLDATTNKPL